MKFKVFLTTLFTLCLILVATSIPSYAADEVDLSQFLPDLNTTQQIITSYYSVPKGSQYSTTFTFSFSNYIYTDDFVMLVALDNVTSTVQFGDAYSGSVNIFGRYTVYGELLIYEPSGTSHTVITPTVSQLVRNNNQDGSTPRWTASDWTPVLRFDVSSYPSGSFISAFRVICTFTNTHSSNTYYSFYNRATITSITARTFGALEASQVIGEKIDQATQDILNNQGTSGNASQVIQDQHDSELSMQQNISDIFAPLGDIPTVPPMSLDSSFSGSLLVIGNTFDSLSEALGFQWNIVWNFLVVIGCLGAILGVTGAVVGLSKSESSSRQSNNNLRSKGGSD